MFEKWKQALDKGKTVMPIIDNNRQYSIIDKDISSESIELDNKTLHTKAEQKLLGVVIDEDSNFQGDKMSSI